MRSLVLLCLLFAISLRAQWQLQGANTTADLRGIDYAGDGVAWASGTNGTILHTQDMGVHWHACVIPPGAQQLDFRGIQAFDSNTATVMSSGKGDLSRLYETTDGCQTWKLVLTNPDKEEFWDALSLNSPKSDVLGHQLGGSHGWGYVLGDPVDGTFRLFSTQDGGETWHQRIAAPRGPKGEGCKVDEFGAEANEAAFAASNQSLLALEGTYLLFVTGGGRARLHHNDLYSLDGALCHESTHSLKLPLVQGGTSSGAFAVAAPSNYQDRSNLPDKLVIVGGDYRLPDATAGTAATVTQLGVFWATVKAAKTPPHGYRSSVAYDKRHNTWITVGPNGADISTDDGRIGFL